MQCNVVVQLRPDILDPEGKAILHALHSLGYNEVQQARVGKIISLALDGNDRGQLETRVTEMSEQLLANPVIENFYVEWPE